MFMYAEDVISIVYVINNSSIHIQSWEFEQLETKLIQTMGRKSLLFPQHIFKKPCSEVIIYIFKKATMMEKTVKISNKIDRYDRIFALQTSASCACAQQMK